MTSGDSSAWKRGDPIGYIRAEAPEFAMPAYQGEQYERSVPDTLDVAARADLAIRFITNLADPDADGEVYWPVLLNRNPPVMWHDWNGFAIQPKFQEALPLLRGMTGNQCNIEVDRTWVRTLLRMQGEDGLIYMPAVGRPWARLGTSPGWFKGDDGGDQFAAIHVNGHLAGVMALYYRQTGEELWKEGIERLVDRLAQLMVYKDDYCYFPMLTASPGACVTGKEGIIDPDCREESGGSVAGWIIHGLCQAYLTIGYEPALTLAGRLAVYLIKHSGCYDEEARFLGMAHTHHHLKPLIGLLEYALITADTDIMEFARKGYEYARSCGSPTIGFYPSIPGPDATYDYKTVQYYFGRYSEGCSVADFIALGVKLSQAGIADCWDDADRCARNHFFESQMLRSDWIERMHRKVPPTPVDESKFETADRLAERHIGAFASYPMPNDLISVVPFGQCRGFMHCCSGNMTRTIYYLWENILSFESGTLRVNLLLNRASPWADLDSYVPYEGRADLHIRVPCSLEVRIPEWVKPEETGCTVNGEARSLGWQGRYARVGPVKPKDAVTLTFPIAERMVKETIGGVDYTLAVKGNDVVLIDPPGRHYPFYRDKGRYRENKAQWVKRRRLVSPEPICWR